MLKNRGVSWVLALALACVGLVVFPTRAAAATTITVSAAQNVQAQMALHYGSTAASASGGTANYQASDCLRLGSEAGTATTGNLANTGGTAISSAKRSALMLISTSWSSTRASEAQSVVVASAAIALRGAGSENIGE